jgi:hypothetical protein
MKSLALILVCVGTPVAAMDTSPYEAHGYVDVRAVAVDSSLTTFKNGGLGLLRFDEDHDGLQFGRLTLDLSGPLTDTVRAQVTAIATGDADDHPLDLTEAFLEWRPYPQSQWRWRSKLGAFYPPISLENRGAGWQGIYSLSPSAINTWIGEEVRAIGLEVAATNAGASTQRPYDFSIVAGVYGWDDPMGVLLFQRGWAIHDHEVPLFGDLRRPFQLNEYDYKIEFSHEIDNRPGYYAGVETKWLGRHVLRVLHYDNRGDPAQSNRTDSAWRSRFDSVGVRLELPFDFTVIAQGMQGDTGVGASADGRGMLIAEFWSYFALGSYCAGQHRFTLRYDRMYVESTRGAQYFNSEQDAHAWTAAYMYNHDEHWLVAVEGLRIDGILEQRELTGRPAAAVERQLQLAVRYSF